MRQMSIGVGGSEPFGRTRAYWPCRPCHLALRA